MSSLVSCGTQRAPVRIGFTYGDSCEGSGIGTNLYESVMGGEEAMESFLGNALMRGSELVGTGRWLLIPGDYPAEEKNKLA